MIERKLSTGERLFVFDDVFTSVQINEFARYAALCRYTRIPIYSGSQNSRSSNEEFFGSILSDADLKELGIFNTQGFNTFSTYFINASIKRAWILCSESSTKYLYHTDAGVGSLTMLYYMNTFWHPEWGGETIFCNNIGEPEIAVACKPNRVVIFPSNLLHKPSGTSRDSVARYTFTTTFIKKE
jgi:hypothetical protein